MGGGGWKEGSKTKGWRERDRGRERKRGEKGWREKERTREKGKKEKEVERERREDNMYISSQ